MEGAIWSFERVWTWGRRRREFGDVLRETTLTEHAARPFNVRYRVFSVDSPGVTVRWHPRARLPNPRGSND